MKKWLKIALPIAAVALVAALAGGYTLYRRLNAGRSSGPLTPRQEKIIAFLSDPAGHTEWMLGAGTRCAEAPFQMPSDGYIGFGWDDSFYPGHHHSGLDIFGGQKSGLTPVYAAYDGYLTRESGWKSSLILRIPSDPLQPDRQIWTYYTHMANRWGIDTISDAFPPGSSEVFVKAGTLLGYQGNYSGDLLNPVGVHLHFSIVKDDGSGNFLDERLIENTLDPSPYFNLALNANQNPDDVPLCNQEGRAQP